MKTRLTDIDPALVRPLNDLRETDYYDPLSDDRFRVSGRVKGAVEGFRRIPQAVVESWDGAVNAKAVKMSGTSSGLTIRFQSDTDCLTVSMIIGIIEEYADFSLTGSRGTSVYARPLAASRMTLAGVLQPPPSPATQYAQTFRAPEELTPVNASRIWREWQIILPTYCRVDALAVGIDTAAEIRPPRTMDRPSVLFYGSSITQGANASHPGNTYASQLMRWLDGDPINLGFSGGARGEPAMASLIAEQDLSCAVIDFDHNINPPEHLRDFYPPFIRQIRSLAPDLPLLLISRPDTDHNQQYAAESRLVIAQTCENAKNNGDVGIFFLDGSRCFGTKDRDACTTDLCHPNDLGFYRMARTLFPVLKAILTR